MSNPSYRSIPPNPEFRPATKMWNNEDGRRGATGAPATKSSGKIEQTQKQVNEVIDVMKDNVNRVLERGDRLADLDERADALQFGAHQFQATAKKVKRKYWWKNLKMWIIIGVIVLVIIAIIAISVGTQSSTPSVAPVPAATTVAPPPPQPATAGKT